MSTPQQIQQLIEKYTAPNSAENCTIAEAQAFAAYMASVGMPYDTLIAQQTGGMPADAVALSVLLAKGVPSNVPLLCVGENQQASPDGADPLVIGETIALERARLAALDGANGFTALYVQRHPGATRESAIAAAAQLPVVKDSLPSILEALKTKAGV